MWMRKLASRQDLKGGAHMMGGGDIRVESMHKGRPEAMRIRLSKQADRICNAGGGANIRGHMGGTWAGAGDRQVSGVVSAPWVSEAS